MRDDLVFHYKLARPVTFTRNHTSLVRFRQVRSAVAAPFGSVHTPSSAFSSRPRLPSDLDIDVSQVASQPRPSLSPERSLRSPRTRTLSLLPRALSPTVSYLSLPLDRRSDSLSPRASSPPLSLPLDRRSLVELTLGLCRMRGAEHLPSVSS